MVRVIVVMLAAFGASAPLHADTSIGGRIKHVTARLEVMNTLGRSCQVQMDVSGVDGMLSPACERYLTNINGDYFKRVESECASLTTWVADKTQGSDAPSAAEHQNMEAIMEICPLNYYPYITKPLATMKALIDLE